MNCPQSAGAQECSTIQVIEPDTTLPVNNFSGLDPSLSELGEVALLVGQLIVPVTFAVPKASTNYRFDYLYVDTLNVDPDFAIVPTVETQTATGFTVRLSASPPVTGYILRWRAVVVDFTLTGTQIDAPESLYLQLPTGVDLFTSAFVNARSSASYGFSELRVENLTDPPAQQTPVLAQVVNKTTVGFTVALSPSPPTNNYFLVARTP